MVCKMLPKIIEMRRQYVILNVVLPTPGTTRARKTKDLKISMRTTLICSTKVLDSINRFALHEVLFMFGVPIKLVVLIRTKMSQLTAKVKFKNQLIRFFGSDAEPDIIQHCSGTPHSKDHCCTIVYQLILIVTSR